MQNTQRTLLRELDLQIMQNRTPKQITAYLNTILDRRMRNLRQLLQSSAGQMEQFMILWEYQDCGFNRYRYVAVGTTCEGCTALDGQIFLIDEAEPGVNFGTLHPHCDCKTEILDANGNAVYTISSVKKEEKQKKSSSWMSAFTMAAQAVKQNAADIWSALEKHFSSPLAFLDWLTMGALSDNARRGQIAKDDPTLYNIGNWLTMGTFDMVKGAVKPEKPFSLEHWLDSLGTVLLGLDVFSKGHTLTKKINENTILQQLKSDLAETPHKNRVVNEIKFGSDKKSFGKLTRQMDARGWSKDSVISTVNRPYTKRKSVNKATGNVATVYYNRDGSHVIIDDLTREIVQISDKYDPNWKPDPGIVNPYVKKGKKGNK